MSAATLTLRDDDPTWADAWRRESALRLAPGPAAAAAPHAPRSTGAADR